MNDAQVLQIVSGALVMAGKLAAPMLMSALVIGTAVSLVQAVTQVQEQTLTFVPKLVGMAVVILVGGSWMIGELIAWVEALWAAIPSLAG